jgi:mRNA-degrading endonuclease RelE of RelBE toxin-antitoxin system
LYELIPHDDLEEDLERLLGVDPKIVSQVLALIEQLQADPDLLDDLLRDGYGGTPWKPAPKAVFNVRAWGRAQDRGLNLWAVRDFELSRMGFEFRIVYAIFPESQLIYLLAIIERAWNYDVSSPISRRIFDSYRALEEDLW